MEASKKRIRSEEHHRKERERMRESYKLEPQKHIDAVMKSRKKTLSDPEKKAKYLERMRNWYKTSGRGKKQKEYLDKFKKENPFAYKARNIGSRYKIKITKEDLVNLWESQNGRCPFTNRVLDIETAQLDHMLPKSRGGLHEISNFRWVTKEVNYLKGDMTDDELLEFIGSIVLHKFGVVLPKV